MGVSTCVGTNLQSYWLIPGMSVRKEGPTDGPQWSVNSNVLVPVLPALLALGRLRRSFPDPFLECLLDEVLHICLHPDRHNCLAHASSADFRHYACRQHMADDEAIRLKNRNFQVLSALYCPFVPESQRCSLRSGCTDLRMGQVSAVLYPVILACLHGSSPGGDVCHVSGAQPAMLQSNDGHCSYCTRDYCAHCQRFHLHACGSV